jgi:hypothetical protein
VSGRDLNSPIAWAINLLLVFMPMRNTVNACLSVHCVGGGRRVSLTEGTLLSLASSTGETLALLRDRGTGDSDSEGNVDVDVTMGVVVVTCFRWAVRGTMEAGLRSEGLFRRV